MDTNLQEQRSQSNTDNSFGKIYTEYISTIIEEFLTDEGNYNKPNKKKSRKQKIQIKRKVKRTNNKDSNKKISLSTLPLNDLRLSIKDMNKRRKSEKKDIDRSIDGSLRFSKKRLELKLKSLGSRPEIKDLKQVLKDEWRQINKQSKR